MDQILTQLESSLLKMVTMMSMVAAITTGCEILYDSRKLDTKLHMHKFKAIKSSVLTGH